jgi:hypothetical protein
MARQEGGQCSIGPVKARTAWLAGAAGAAIAVWRRVRPAPESEPAPAEDPRAEELRRKLEESRTVVEEQHEQAAEPETPVDEAPDTAVDASVDDRRAAVHERARAAADEMRREDEGR